MRERPILEVALVIESKHNIPGKGNLYAVKYRGHYGVTRYEYVYANDELDATIKTQKLLRDPDNGE